VQRTGWGKSAVYFVATRMLRSAGTGPSLIISPLLALMRDQIAAAQRAGVRAASLNSSNVTEWDSVLEDLRAGSLDVLLVSPDRLNNPQFRAEVLPQLLSFLGLIVVDEAHCISDWRHDFRPDYRRIGHILAELPANTPVLATTTTANPPLAAGAADQLHGQFARGRRRRRTARSRHHRRPRRTRPRLPAPRRPVRPRCECPDRVAGLPPVRFHRIGHRLHAHRLRR